MLATPVLAQGGIDTNELVFDEVWPLIGPGGTYDDVAGDLTPALSEPFGGEDTDSVAFDGEGNQLETHTLAGQTCGDEDVVMSSPNPFFFSSEENQIFEATGSFFIDIEIEDNREDAEENPIDQVHFGYLTTFPWPVSGALCDEALPLGLTGAYYEFYRGDTNGDDGWEIPVNTLLVPDMAYGAVLRVMDTNGNFVKTAFVYANVNNYANDLQFRPGTPATCVDEDNNPIACPYQDVTPPFPTVTGIDGKDFKGNAANACAGDLAAIEYGEPLSAIEVLDGNGQLTLFDGDDRDVDPVLLVTTATEPWGPSYCLTGASGDVTIKAVDQSGNIGYRTITV